MDKVCKPVRDVDNYVMGNQGIGGAAALPILSMPTTQVQLPEDVLRIIYREYMSKPAIHFAAFQFYVPFNSWSFSISLTEWSKGDIKSGYVSADILGATCWVARDVANKTAVNPSLIRYHRYHGGTKRVDTATDLLCFVHTGPHCQPFDRRPSLDYGRVHDTVERIHRAGVLVTRSMWYEVLEKWFLPLPSVPAEQSELHDLRARGPLGSEPLAILMACVRNLDSFYLIVPDVTEDDWNQYYSHLPVVFHDHAGSYVEAVEQPLHKVVVSALWKDGEELYPYPTGSKPTLGKDIGFGRRVDKLMSPRQRVSMLQGLLSMAGEVVFLRMAAKRELSSLGVLVRRPTSICSSAIASDVKPDEDGETGDMVLNTGDSEAKWVKRALRRVMDDSAGAYAGDKGLRQ